MCVCVIYTDSHHWKNVDNSFFFVWAQIKMGGFFFYFNLLDIYFFPVCISYVFCIRICQCLVLMLKVKNSI